jgi:hypothetical protein
MKIKIVLFTAILALAYACGEAKKDGAESPSKEALKTSITQMEDSLKQLQSNLAVTKEIPNLTKFELINRLLNFYQSYPEDDYAALCLDKVHMAYSGMGIHIRSIQYGDTLLMKYPNYINRSMVLESQGSNYDIFLEPRDTGKVKYYYELLLKENPTMEKEKRDGIKDRLKHINLTFDQYIDSKMHVISKN